MDVANAYVDPLGGLNIINVADWNEGEYECVAKSLVTGEETVSR